MLNHRLLLSAIDVGHRLWSMHRTNTPIMRHQCQHAVLTHETQNAAVSESDKVNCCFNLSCHVYAMNNNAPDTTMVCCIDQHILMSLIDGHILMVTTASYNCYRITTRVVESDSNEIQWYKLHICKKSCVSATVWSSECNNEKKLWQNNIKNMMVSSWRTQRNVLHICSMIQICETVIKKKTVSNSITSLLDRLYIYIPHPLQSQPRFYNHYLMHLPLPTLFLPVSNAQVDVFSPWESQNVCIHCQKCHIFMTCGGGEHGPHGVPNWILLGWGDGKTKLFETH
jgi:hypothetical protein